MKRVFCLGNGESRKDVNLSALKAHGKIYGCNALYRDFTLMSWLQLVKV